MRSLLIVGFVFLLSVSAVAERNTLRPNSDYRAARSNAVTYEVDFRVVVTAPYHTRLLKVWVPIPQSGFDQTVHSRSIETFPQSVKAKISAEPVFGNQFAYFEFRNPKGAQIIRHRFKVTVYELRWGVDSTRVVTPPEWPKSFRRYLDSDQTIVINKEIAGQARKLGGKGNAARGLFSAMDWLHENMTYDHSIASLEGSSLHAWEKRRGHCSDYHGLCSAFGRALGFPTRVVYGMAMFPKNSPSHCKLEAYLPPYGWVSFDVSETQKLLKKIKSEVATEADRKKLIQAALSRLRGGFRDNTWLRLTRGTGYELAPKAAKKVAVVRTIYAEADGKRLPDPDPADVKKLEHAWMTTQKIKADRRVTYPFKDIGSLRRKDVPAIPACP